MTETQTVDLAAWLTAIWDEEERGFDLACEAEAERCRNDGIPNMTAAEIKTYWQTLPDWGGWKLPLARIAADRKILELHQPSRDPDTWYWDQRECAECGHLWHGRTPSGTPPTVIGPEHGCPTVRLLASPYKGREGWQESWE